MKHIIAYVFAAALLVSVSGYANEPEAAATDAVKEAETATHEAAKEVKAEAKKTAKKAKKKAKKLHAPTEPATDTAPAAPTEH